MAILMSHAMSAKSLWSVIKLGVSYTDDISGAPLDKKLAYQLQVTKFEDESTLIKSKVFYISLETMKKLLGTTDMEWKTIKKVGDKWEQQ